MADIEPEAQDWLWDGWIPLGNVTLLVGEGGVLKSTVMADLAARISTSRLMPDGARCLRGGIVWCSLEEQVNSQVVPRLISAGAAMSKIWVLHEVSRKVERLGDPVKSPFMIPDDLEALERCVKRVKASLVIIDPLMAAVNPKVSTFRGQSASALITKCQTMAERLGIAIVIIGHFTKGSSRNIINRIGGSKVFTNQVRSIIIVTRDSANASHSIMSLEKHSCSGERPQIVFERNELGGVTYLTGMDDTQQTISAIKQQSLARQGVLSVLNGRPGEDFTPTEIAQEVNLDYGYIKVLLRRMAKDGTIINDAWGMYHSQPVVTTEVA